MFEEISLEWLNNLIKDATIKNCDSDYKLVAITTLEL